MRHDGGETCRYAPTTPPRSRSRSADARDESDDGDASDPMRPMRVLGRGRKKGCRALHRRLARRRRVGATPARRVRVRLRHGWNSRRRLTSTADVTVIAASRCRLLQSLHRLRCPDRSRCTEWSHRGRLAGGNASCLRRCGGSTARWAGAPRCLGGAARMPLQSVQRPRCTDWCRCTEWSRRS